MLPVFDKENSNTKDKIISILATEPNLNTKKINAILKKQYSLNVTYQAIHKTLKQMVEQGVLKFDGKCYSIESKWIESLKLFVHKLEKGSHSDDLASQIDKVWQMNESSVINIKLKCFNELIEFLDSFEEEFCKNNNDDIIATGQVYNILDFFSDKKLKNKLTKYILSKGNTILDNLTVLRHINDNTFIRTGIDNVNSQFHIFGDYIIEINYFNEAVVQLGKKYQEVNTINDLRIEDFKSFFGKPQDIMITILKNKALAEHRQSEILDKYLGQFNSLIEDFKKQKSSSLPLSVNLKYHYLSYQQNHFTEEANEIRREKFSFQNIELDLVEKYGGKILKDKFEDNINLIELGPGDCKKTIKLLSRWYTQFKTINYTGVDYSKMLLEEGSKNMSEELAKVNLSYINQDFEEFSKGNKVSEPKAVLLLSFKYGNFKRKDMNEWLNKLVNEEDVLILGMQLFSSKEEMLKKFNINESKRAAVGVLCELGFPVEDLSYTISFNKNSKEVESYAKIINMPKHLPPKVKEIGLKQGDEILLFSSWKPTIDELKAALSDYYPEFNEDKKTGVVVCILRRKIGLNFLIDNLEIRVESGERGAFATAPIKKGTKIYKYAGKMLDHRTKHSVQLDENKHMDGPIMFDHSCNPNCFFDWNGYIITALNDIKKGEKITYNYLTHDEEFNFPFKCYCGSKNCKVLIKGFKFLTKDEKKELKPFLSPFLKRKYKKELE